MLEPGPFFGRDAGVFAWGARPEWWTQEFGYGRKAEVLSA